MTEVGPINPIDPLFKLIDRRKRSTDEDSKPKPAPKQEEDIVDRVDLSPEALEQLKKDEPK